MKIPAIGLGLIMLAVIGACTACGSSAPEGSSGGQPPGMSMSPGMTMPDGSVMGAEDTGPSSAPADGPSASALMVCSDEIRSDVTQVAALPTKPRATSMFKDHLYTCTYTLPMGALIVSVKDLDDSAATTAFFEKTRDSLGTTRSLAGLAQGAFGTNNGRVVLRKDNHVLSVDASQLPAVFGTQSQKRTDFAYEIASDILGCWTEG
jgi:hypothetical protein